MTDRSARPRKVLAVMDDGDDQIALRTATALADRHGAELGVMGCVEPPHDLSVIARVSGRDAGQLLSALRTRKHDEMQTRLAALCPDRSLETTLTVGKTFVEVIRHVIEGQFDFVVKAAEPLSGVHRLLFASTDQHLLRKCPCPVWLQTPTAQSVAKRVIAAVDVDVSDAAEPQTLHSLNRRVVETARMIAAPMDAQVVVLHAWEAIGEGLVWAFSADADARGSADAYVEEVFNSRQHEMDRLLREVSGNGSHETSVPFTPRLVRGAPQQVIEEESRALEADAVVMGTVARTGLSGIFIGNTAENIINSLECPVLAVKPDRFVSPLDTR